MEEERSSRNMTVAKRTKRRGKILPSARIWQGKLTIPTYQVGPPVRHPNFFAHGHVRIYPYTRIDDLLHRKRKVTYKAVYLENEYLKVIVLPQLGGHLYSAYDKLAREELFYRNHVIKPGRVLLRGSWTPVGIEFNFPRGHSVTSLTPVDYRLLENPEGSVSVAVGDCEQQSRMRWTVIITLRPGKRRVELTTRLSNRTGLPHRYYFWANAAVAANDQLQFISPARAARRLGRYMPFPYVDGVDKRWYKNHFHSTDLFTVDCPHDFFGYYDHGRDFGAVHVADRHILPGKKLFTWGAGDRGRVWSEMLSDDDGPYIEIQAGSHETQSEFSLFEPHTSISWQEYWYPVWKLGPFDGASETAALHLETDDGRAGDGTARVRLQVTEPLRGCTLEFSVDGRKAASRKVSLPVGAPRKLAFHLPPVWQTVEVELRDAKGHTVVRHQREAQPDYGLARRKEFKEEADSPEALYRKTIHLLHRGEVQRALESFEGSLKLDPHFSPARRDRGMLGLTRGLWHQAREDLEAALLRSPEDAAARYYLAVALRELGQVTQALDEALVVAARTELSRQGWQLAGELHLEARRFTRAERAFREVLARKPVTARSAALLSAALRHQGRHREAKDAARAALELDPLEHLALAELWRLKADGGMFRRTLRGEAQSYLEVASDYLRTGLLTDARTVLEAYLKQERKHPSPLACYYMGYVARKLGDGRAARKYYRQAGKLPFDYVFPHRLETERVLRAALEHYPGQARTHYYLGNLLAFRYRYEEALACWERAVQLEDDIAPCHRNIGLARWHLYRDARRAVAAYRQAIALATDDVDLYWELDGILAARGRSRQRVELLSSAPAEVIGNDKVAKNLAAAYYGLGRYNKVLEVLGDYEFWPWEGERTPGRLYAGAHTAKAMRALERGQYRAAHRHFQQSMVFPPNLHMGQSLYPRFAKQKYLMAHCLEKLGKEEEARKVLESAAQEHYVGWDRGFCEALYYKGLSLVRLGRAGEAKKVFRRLIRGPDETLRSWHRHAPLLFLEALGHRGLAELEDRRKHLQESQKLLKAALAERADFPEVRQMLDEVKRLLRRRR